MAPCRSRGGDRLTRAAHSPERQHLDPVAAQQRHALLAAAQRASELVDDASRELDRALPEQRGAELSCQRDGRAVTRTVSYAHEALEGDAVARHQDRQRRADRRQRGAVKTLGARRVTRHDGVGRVGGAWCRGGEEGRLDQRFTELREIEGIEYTLNAGAIGLTLPNTSMTGSIRTNAGAVRLCAPEGVALRLHTGESVIAAYDYGDQGLVQDGSTAEMVFDIPALVAHVSSVLTLLPGDVIITVTPEGVGTMNVGDEIEVSIAGIGTLTNKVALR